MILPFQGLGNSAFMLFRTSKKYFAATFVVVKQCKQLKYNRKNVVYSYNEILLMKIEL